MNTKYKPLEVGLKVGKWIILQDLGISKRRHRWSCQCECGVVKSVIDRGLKIGTSTSCQKCARLYQKNTKLPLPGFEAALNSTFSAYKTAARERNLSWELTKEEFFDLTQKSCSYCGAKPSNRRKSRSSGEDFIYNGVDRLRNKKGYFLENVTTCCRRCNKFKSDMDIDDFKALIGKIHSHTQGYIRQNRDELVTKPGYEWLMEQQERY